MEQSAPFFFFFTWPIYEHMNINFREFIEQQEKEKVLIIMRGVSGSGKSTLAKKLHSQLGGVIYSTDDFFINPKTGAYEFDPSKLAENHEANKERTALAMRQGISPIIIDNTNLKKWEMLPYVLLADQFGYEPVIKEPDAVDIEELMQRQALRKGKSLPKEIVLGMQGRYEPVSDIQSIRDLQRKN